MLLLAVALPFASGCSWVTSSDIPDPFSEDLILDKVITEIRLEGNVDTRDDIIRRAMISMVGDVYTEQSARLDRRWMHQLGVFTSIHFETIPDGEGVILVVRVTEVNPYLPAPALKITEENGLEIGVSLSSPNLLGYAARLSFWARFGGATNIGLRFKDPALPEFSWGVGYQIDYFHMERLNKVFEFDESSDDFAFQYLPHITQWLMAGPRISFLSVKSDQPDITLDPDNRDDIPGIGLSVQLDSRDMPVYPTDGWWSEVLVSKFGLFGVDTDYWQGNLDIRRYLQLAGPEQSLAIYSLTTLTSGEVDVDIPEYMQFVLGGANTVRGWDLGSRIGKNQFINTVEYWHMLKPLRRYEFWFLKQAIGLQGAVVVDVGTAWNNNDEFHRNWIGGAGVGLRLIIPSITMVRFDVAVGEGGPKVGIFIGSQEAATIRRDRVR